MWFLFVLFLCFFFFSMTMVQAPESRPTHSRASRSFPYIMPASVPLAKQVTLVKSLLGATVVDKAGLVRGRVHGCREECRVWLEVYFKTLKNARWYCKCSRCCQRMRRSPGFSWLDSSRLPHSPVSQIQGTRSPSSIRGGRVLWW